MKKTEKLELSRTGQDRREQMLHDLKDEVRMFHNRRIRRRMQVKSALLLLVGTPLLWLTWSAARIQLNGESENVLVTNEFARFESLVAHSRDIHVDEFVAHNKPKSQFKAATLTDEQMLELIAEHAEPCEIVTINGEPTVVPSRPAL